MNLTASQRVQRSLRIPFSCTFRLAARGLVQQTSDVMGGFQLGNFPAAFP